MKKKEAMNFIRKQKGYIPYISLFELYGDDDEIPQELINIECKKELLKSNFMICSAELAEQINKLK